MRGLTVALITVLALNSGCAKLIGTLRRDFDDGEVYGSPTTGGRWAERGLLSEDPDSNPYMTIGHSERSPAGAQFARGGGERGAHSWLTREDAEGQRRDQMRGKFEGGPDEEVSYADTPNLPPQKKRLYKNGARATRSDFVDESTNEGSLWASDGQTNYYFTKNKIRGTGDIVTVTLEPDMVRDLITEVTRTLSPREKEAEVAFAQERLRAKALGLDDPDAKFAAKDTVASSAAGPNRAPAAAAGPTPAAGAGAAKPAPKDESDVEIATATSADIDVAKSLAIKGGDTMMTEITERFPNGNFKLMGRKKVPYRNDFRIITLVAVVKGADISEEDQVSSGKLYEYRLEATR